LKDFKPISQRKQEISWDARQHQFNFVRRLSWSISRPIFQRKFTLSMRRSLK